MRAQFADNDARQISLPFVQVIQTKPQNTPAGKTFWIKHKCAKPLRRYFSTFPYLDPAGNPGIGAHVASDITLEQIITAPQPPGNIQ
jgi:hypothetical protein